MGQSGAYPRTMVVRGNAVRACIALERRDTRRTDRPLFRRPEVRDPRRRFRPHGPRLRPHSPQTQPAPSMRPETPPPAQLGPGSVRLAVRRCRASEGRVNVQLLPQGTRLGRPQADPRDRQDRPPGRWRGAGPLRRHDRAVHRRGGEKLPARAGFLPVDRELSGEGVRRGQNPRRLLQARGPAERGRGAEEPPDRPADPPAVPRGLSQRGPDRRHGAEP